MKKQESGQVLVLFLAAFLLLACCWATLLVIGLRTIRRIHAQDTADAVALSVAVARSRGLNAVGAINALMGPMMFKVEKGPLTKLLKGALLLHPEFSGQINSLPDNFWLVYNPLVPSADAMEALFTGLIKVRQIYFDWGSGAQLEIARRAVTANGMDWGRSAALSELFANMRGDLQPLMHDPHASIVYFSSRAGIPFPPIKKGEGDLMWLKDRRGPRPYSVTVQNGRGDLRAVSAARPYNGSGSMFPVYGKPLGGGNSNIVKGKMFSWFRKASGLLKKVASWAGVSWGIEATIDYLQAKDDGWDAQLVAIKKKQVSHLVVELTHD